MYKNVQKNYVLFYPYSIVSILFSKKIITGTNYDLKS